MQPVSDPVRRDVRPVSPHRPDFLSADRLPDVLPILDVLSCEQDVTIAGDDTLRDRRSHTINLPPEIPEYRKGTNDDHRQAEPHSSIMHENPLRLEIGVYWMTRSRSATNPSMSCQRRARAVCSRVWAPPQQKSSL